MRVRPLLSPKAIHDFSAAEFYSYCQALVIHPDSKASKTVPEVTISVTKKSVIVRIRRSEKFITEKELEALQTEHPAVDLKSVLTKKKIKILDEEGKQTNEFNIPTKRKPRVKKEHKGDALPQ